MLFLGGQVLQLIIFLDDQSTISENWFRLECEARQGQATTYADDDTVQ